MESIINFIKSIFIKKQENKIIYVHKGTGIELGQAELEADTITNKNNWTAVIVPVDYKLN